MDRDQPTHAPPSSSPAQPSGGPQPAAARKISTRSLVTEQLASELTPAEPISSTGERQVVPGRSPPNSKTDDYIGRIIDGRYLVEALIGAGGMGVVYQCRHRIIGKKLAIKIIRREQARTTEAPQRFLIEARAASAIGSEHIIHVSDFGRLPDGAAYLVMEFLEGAALSEAIERREPLSLGRVLAIGIQLAEGLSAAHRAGIVHRDLKPENIFLVRRHDDRDFVKILDFGVAQMSLHGARKLTRAGCIVGTPQYMSPEQAGAERVDQRGDIYSLGIILYELICGRVPFDGHNYRTILSQHLLEAPAPFNLVAPWLEVPTPLEQIVRRCLEKQPSDRYGSMAELCAELRRCEDTLAARDGKSPSSFAASTFASNDIETGTRAVARMSKTTLADGIGRGWLYAAGASLVLLASLGGWIAARGTGDSANIIAPAAPAPRAVSAPPPTPPLPAIPPASDAPASHVQIERDALGSVANAAPDSAPKAADYEAKVAPGPAPKAAGYRAKVAAGSAPKAARSTLKASGTSARRKARSGKQPARRSKARSDLVNPGTLKR